MAGKGTFQGRAVAAPYGPPRVEGALSVRAFHFLQLDLGDVTATALATPDLVLRIRDGVGRKAESSYTVETTIDLGATPIRILPSRATARGRMRDLFDVVMPWLPTAKLFQDAIDGSVQLTMPFEGDVPKVNMAFQGTLGRGRSGGGSSTGGASAPASSRGSGPSSTKPSSTGARPWRREAGRSTSRPRRRGTCTSSSPTCRSTASTSPATAGAGPWTGTPSSAAPWTTR